MLQEFLGITPILHRDAQPGAIRISAEDGKELLIRDHFFPAADKAWLSGRALPRIPLRRIALSALPVPVCSAYSDLPLLFCSAESSLGPVISASPTHVDCSIDIFGSCFFLLSRYEEAVGAERDRWDRFPFEASILSSEDLIERPLVNEYLEVLWSCLAHLWPTLERRQRAYALALTHDVDRPLSMSMISAGRAAAKTGAALFLHRNPRLALRRLNAYVDGQNGRYDKDPSNTFDLMMTAAEERGVRGAYYFITGNRAGRIDGNYDVRDPWIRALLRSIHDRGHEIGIHGSFTTYKDATQLSSEVALLKQVCEDENVGLASIGGRQHYLRWSVLDTWDIWDDVGLSYDSTLGFAEHCGFRAGTCYEFPAYSLRHRRQLRLRERPLVVMDVTLSAQQYMALSISEAKRRIRYLADVCRFYRGSFVCLFHNNSLETAAYKRFFLETLAVAS
jgi:hypothetical protein